MFLQQFEMKKQAREYIQALISRYSDNDPLSKTDEEIVISMLMLHPSVNEKIGCGIKSICIRTVNFRKPTRCFWITRTDGSEEDFSWTKCIDVGDSAMKYIYAACRSAIDFEMKEAKRDLCPGGFGTCSISGKRVSFEQAHLHHKKPYDFKTIVKIFLDTIKPVFNVSTIKVIDDGPFKKVFASKEMSELFRAFHHKLADLELVDAKIHLKLKRKAE